MFAQYAISHARGVKVHNSRGSYKIHDAETEIPFQKETLFLEMFEDVILFCYDFSFSEPVLLGKDR